jgi:hypothetical protein
MTIWCELAIFLRSNLVHTSRCLSNWSWGLRRCTEGMLHTGTSITIFACVSMSQAKRYSPFLWKPVHLYFAKPPKSRDLICTINLPTYLSTPTYSYLLTMYSYSYGVVLRCQIQAYVLTGTSPSPSLLVSLPKLPPNSVLVQYCWNTILSPSELLL